LLEFCFWLVSYWLFCVEKLRLSCNIHGIILKELSVQSLCNFISSGFLSFLNGVSPALSLGPPGLIGLPLLFKGLLHGSVLSSLLHILDIVDIRDVNQKPVLFLLETDFRICFFFSLLSRKLHKNYQMWDKINSHICLMLSVYKSFH